MALANGDADTTVDLAFDRTPDPLLDGTASPRAVAMTSVSRGGPAPLTMYSSNGHAIATTAPNGHTNGHAAAAAAATSATVADTKPGTPTSPAAGGKRKKTLQDVGLGQDEFDRNPEERASCCSRLTYRFANPLIDLGNERALERDDLWQIAKADKSDFCTAEFARHFEERKAQAKAKAAAAGGDVKKEDAAGVLGTALSYNFWNLMLVLVCEFPNKADSMIQPIFLQKIIEWVADPSQDEYIGWAYACGMLCSALLSNTSYAYVMEMNAKIHLRVRAAVSGLVYEKSLRLSNAGRKETTTGEIVNLMSSDADKIAQSASYSTTASFLVPAQVAILIWLIYRILGPSTFAGLGVLFGMVPILFVIIMKTMVLYEARATLADQRVKLTSEVLQGIRVVKFYGWENSFHKRLTDIRNKELTHLRDLNMMSSFYVFFFLLLPVLTALAAFGTYVRLGHTLDPASLFGSLAYFNALQVPLVDMPQSFAGLVQGIVASGRLNDFFAQPEVDAADAAKMDAATASTTAATAPAGSVAVAIRNGSSSPRGAPATDGGWDPAQYPVWIRGGEFRWDVTPDGLKRDPTLRNVEFRAPAGKLTAIVGKVGSGKTSLLSAVLGEIARTNGSVYSPHGIAYVAQTAWIQNLTVQQNIAFGLPFDAARYDAVVHATALDADISILPAGSNTEIGEKGINLSGGQKQRVALSRAVYSPTPVLLMDDPLSAVDAHVAEHIFTRCITGPLCQHKTRVLVTNQLHFLPRCDYIYVVANGTIAESGTYEQLSAADGGSVHFKELVKTHTEELTKAREAKVKDANAADAKGDEKHAGTANGAAATAADAGAAPAAGGQQKKGKLVQAEELSTTKVTGEVYAAHLRAMGGWKWMTVLGVIFCLGQGTVTFSSFWLSWWSEDRFDRAIKGDSDPNTYYMVGLAIITAVSGVLLLARSMLFAQTSVWASAVHHSRLLDNVQRAPASFFDETPVGRVLNRFAKDMDDIDTGVPSDMQGSLGIVSMIAANFIAIAVIVPLYLTVCVVVMVLFAHIQRQYKGAALQSERINSVTRSPVFQNFTETLNGVTTIRAYGAAERFRLQNYRLLDANSQAMYTSRLVFRWALVRIGILNSLMTFGAAVFLCARRDDLNPGQVGIALSFVLAVGGFMAFALQMLTEWENKMNSVERVSFYTDTKNVPNEAVWEVPGEPALPRDVNGQLMPWPSRGEVDVNSLVMAYRPALEPAIKGLTVRFNSQEKVGVAGRTGSGKSSLMLCLFRLYESRSGSIRIDGVDISAVGLHTLRKRLAIIPQDPVVFSGTIRDNLDPFSEYDDAAIERALGDVHLLDFVKKQKNGLLSEVAEYGENLSVGQCQLLCIARALLRDPKIILMDEATSSIDSVTDALIQHTVSVKFARATVITIAHRLNTIMNADRVLVMRDGKAAEFDSPAALLALKGKGGVFASMHASMVASTNSAANA